MITQRFKILLAAGLLAGLIFWPRLAQPGQAAFPWPQLTFKEIATGFNNPTFITHAPGDSQRLFVVEQAGQVWVLSGGKRQGTPYLNITDRVHSPASGGGGEQGLLSIVFSPQYPARQMVYAAYTAPDGALVVASFPTGGSPETADAAREKVILRIPHPDYANHNGGQLAFGPDGYLYIGTGDGGGGGDPNGNAQNPATLSGKLLRIEVEPPVQASQLPSAAGPVRLFLPVTIQATASSQEPYRIPPDNPFANVAGYRGEIWALGLRNPWRFSFDPATNELYIGDVGQGQFEEVDVQPAGQGGQNYGWNIVEGQSCYGGGNCNPAAFTLPVFVYSHIDNNCSITGGYVYRGTAFPALQGIYFFGDYCSGQVWGLVRDGQVWNNKILANTGYRITSFGVDQAGELYLVDKGGTIYQVQGTGVQLR